MAYPYVTTEDLDHSTDPLRHWCGFVEQCRRLRSVGGDALAGAVFTTWNHMRGRLGAQLAFPLVWSITGEKTLLEWKREYGGEYLLLVSADGTLREKGSTEDDSAPTVTIDQAAEKLRSIYSATLPDPVSRATALLAQAKQLEADANKAPVS